MGENDEETLMRAGIAQPARIEVHGFDTLTMTDTEFLTAGKAGVPASIGGALRFPPGGEQVPAVILVHGSAGIGTNVHVWAGEINRIGVAAFILDSFTGRGIAQTVTDQSQLGSLAMIVDSYRALALLAKHARIDTSRVAVMGFSKGGFVALYSSLHRFRRMYGPASSEFAAHIALYPQCNTVFLDDEQVSDRPIRLFHGTGDDYVCIRRCRAYVERLHRIGKDIELTEYPGAQHGFDNPAYSPGCFVADAVTTNGCLREERAGGQIFNVVTGKPFSWKDSCVRRGATLAYDPKATVEVTKAVIDLLISIFELKQ